MNCPETQSMMHGYLDGELQAPIALQYEEHMRQCPVCSKMLAEQKELQRAMKSHDLYHMAPVSLHERLRKSLRQPSGRRVYWPWVAMAASLLICVGIGFVLAQLVVAPSQQERLTAEVVSSHVRSLQVDKSRLVDRRSTDRHEVKPWFTDKLDFSPPVPDLSKQGFELLGGRMDYLDGRPVAALVYKRRQHVINVFLWPDAGNYDTQPRRETRQGFQLISWSNAGMNFWVVSDLNALELDELVQGFK
jgi:anti-sigma factor RsiW